MLCSTMTVNGSHHPIFFTLEHDTTVHWVLKCLKWLISQILNVSPKKDKILYNYIFIAYRSSFNKIFLQY